MEYKLLNSLCFLLLLFISSFSHQSLAESTGAIGPDQNQIAYTREYLATNRLFDQLTDSLIANDKDIYKQVETNASITSWALNKAMREYPFYTALTYATPIAALGIPIAISWSKIKNAFLGLPELVKILSASLAPAGLIFAALPAGVISLQAYYSVIPPTIAESSLIVQYGSKKNLLSPSTQSYIENELFYAYWQNPSTEGLARLHKILDKAMRLPLYTKNLNYNSERITKALSNFSPEIIERLDRFALTEIMLQKMEPKPPSHYPIYFQGSPGTGKTFAAKQLAEAMRTTLATVTLDGASIDDMIGTPFESYDARAGRLLDAIVAKTESSFSVNHQNQILIIDEFDRLLTSNDRKSEEVLGFMLKLLDPAERHFYSPYLKTTIQLPDSIILAGNIDINSLAKREPRLAALASRLETVYFSGFDQEAKQRIADQEIIPRLRKSYQSLGKSMTDFQLPDEGNSRITAFIQTDQDPGLRSLEKYISSVFEEYLIRAVATGGM